MHTILERQHIESGQFDIETRRYYDTVTWLAEVLPGSMRTPFEYTYYNGELYGSDGSTIGTIFDNSIQEAKSLPSYELRRRLLEKEEYDDMLAMMRGDKPNTMVVVSDFPPELMVATQDMGGYNVARKQTMLRVLLRTTDNKLQMYSQSLDGSNRRALEAIYEHLGRNAQPGELLGQRISVDLATKEQEFLTDWLTAVYDRTLQAQYGGEWYAGQLNGRKHNTYDFVRSQQDLLTAYLATTSGFTGGFRDYALAAAMKDRFIGRTESPVAEYKFSGVVAHQLSLNEMYLAGNSAQQRGETFSGCGASIGRNSNLGTESQLQSLGFGNQAGKAKSSGEKLVWKDGVCRIDNCPTRPGKTKVAQCSVCRSCQFWFDKGRDPAKLYKGMQHVQKESFTLQFAQKKQTKIRKTKA